MPHFLMYIILNRGRNLVQILFENHLQDKRNRNALLQFNVNLIIG